MINLHRRNVLALTTIGAMLGDFSYAMAAERYPSQPIKVVLGAAPGGSFDAVMRPLGLQLAEKLGQPIIIENRPGANQAIAASEVARAKPDGYMLFLGTDAAFSIASALATPITYKPYVDFTPLAIVNQFPLALVTRVGSSFATIKEFVALARAQPGKFSYGSPGIGSIAHIAMEVFAQQQQVSLLHVPYLGTVPSVTAVATGEIDVILASIAAVLPLMPARLKSLAVAGTSRNPTIPSTPTFLELGYVDFDVRAWIGLFAPKRTPADVVAVLQREIWQIVNSDAFVSKYILPFAAERSTVPPGEVQEFLAKDKEKWAVWVKRLGGRI